MAEDDRHSKADEPALISDADEKARREVANASAQFDLMVNYITEWVAYTDRPFRFRPSMILDLQRAALDGLSSHAGTFRASSVTISQSAHQPPGAHRVPRLVEDMCDYINDNWNQKSATYLSAYVLWRLNWIHPFDDGNGRTSRAVSYVILCVKSGILLPGEKTIPEQISANKTPYYEALEVADAADIQGRIDVSKLESLLSAMLAAQLASCHRKATGEQYQIDDV